MKANSFIFRATVVACVCAFAAWPVFAEDEEDGDKKEGAAKEEVAPAAPAKPEKFFFPLLRCGELMAARAEVLKPGVETWADAEEGRYYPLGSAFRVTPLGAGARASFLFGTGSRVLITNAAEFATRPIAIGEEKRVLELRAGLIEISLPRVLKDGLFTVAAPYFTCENLAGDSRFDYRKLDDGDEATIRVVTGSLAVKGRHYAIERMGAANRVCLRTTKDDLLTSIRGESGDCLVKLDQGLVAQKDFETGETKDVAKTLDYQLSPLCAIKIWRAVSPIGGNVSVSMMTFSPNGQIMNRCAFAERRSNVNSGELVVTRSAIKDADKKAKESEAEATEAVEVAPAGGEKGDEENKDEKKEEKKDDEEV